LRPADARRTGANRAKTTGSLIGVSTAIRI